MFHNRANPRSAFFTIDAASFSVVMATMLLILFLIELVVFPPLLRRVHGVGIDLPPVNHPMAMPDANREDAIIVVVMRDGKLYFADNRVTGEQLPAKIMERLSHSAERKVYIRADARARYGSVLVVLTAVRSAGVEQVAFLTEQRKATAPRTLGVPD